MAYESVALEDIQHDLLGDGDITCPPPQLAAGEMTAWKEFYQTYPTAQVLDVSCFFIERMADVAGMSTAIRGNVGIQVYPDLILRPDPIPEDDDRIQLITAGIALSRLMRQVSPHVPPEDSPDGPATCDVIVDYEMRREMSGTFSLSAIIGNDVLSKVELDFSITKPSWLYDPENGLYIMGLPGPQPGPLLFTQLAQASGGPEKAFQLLMSKTSTTLYPYLSREHLQNAEV